MSQPQPAATPLDARTAQEGFLQTKQQASWLFEELVLQFATPDHPVFTVDPAMYQLLQDMFVSGYSAGYSQGATDATAKYSSSISERIQGLLVQAQQQTQKETP